MADVSAIITLKDIFEALVPIVQVFATSIITAAVGFAANWLRKKYNISVDAEMRNALDKALTNAAGNLIAKGAVSLEGTKIVITNTAAHDAVEYVMKNAADAVKHFNFTQEDADKIVERIASKIAQMPGTPSVQVAQQAN